MSDPDKGTPGEGTPAPADTPATPAQSPEPPAAPSPPAPAAQKTDEEPHWLKPRLEAAERAAENRVLKALGVDDPKELEEAKEALAAARKRREEEKTLEQRLTELETKQQQTLSEAERFKATATEHAARMMGVLTEEQQSAVKAIAGDDAAMQLKAISALGPTWAQKAADKAASEGDTPKTPPANTSAPKNAPGDTPQVSPPDPVAQYQSLQQANPFAAAAYGLQNPAVYTPKQ